MVTSIIIGFSGFGVKIENFPKNIYSGYNKQSIKYIADKDEDMEDMIEAYSD